MKLAIIGRGNTLYKTALLLEDKGHEIKLIITAKESPEYKIKARDYKSLAEKISAEYIYTTNINDKEIIREIRDANCDIGISENYINIISSNVIDCFKYGILNLHGGDLPRYKGNACQAWAIINGEDKIGLSIHKMEGDKLDCGDIIAKEFFPIDINTKVGEVYDWIEGISPNLTLKVLEKLKKDPDYILEKANYNLEDGLRCYPRNPEDGKIDWRQDNESIVRLINASGRPFIGAYCYFKGKIFYIHNAELFDIKEPYLGVPGQAVEINKEDGSVVVISSKGAVKIKWVVYEEKQEYPANIIKSLRNRLTF